MNNIPEQPILDLLAAHREKGPMNCIELNKNSVIQAMPPGTSRFAAISKMRKLVSRGLVCTDLKGNYWLPNAPGRPAKPTGIKCFLLVPTGKTRRSLRRYRSISVGEDEEQFKRCPNGYHNAMVPLDVVEGGSANDDGEGMHVDPSKFTGWPERCGCGYEFTADDTFQIFKEHIYRRTDTGQEMTLAEAPAGAIWRAEWMESFRKGPDGHCYVVRMPGNWDWCIDGPASNCDMRDKPHQCWVRTGEAPNFTVGKGKPGESCTAGAGSIWIDKGGPADWHGFLTNGVLNHV